jgi:hypothetical protein
MIVSVSVLRISRYHGLAVETLNERDTWCPVRATSLFRSKLQAKLRCSDQDCVRALEGRDLGPFAARVRGPMDPTCRNCNLDLNKVAPDWSDLPCEPQQRRGIARNAGLNRTTCCPVQVKVARSGLRLRVILRGQIQEGGRGQGPGAWLTVAGGGPRRSRHRWSFEPGRR